MTPERKKHLFDILGYNTPSCSTGLSHAPLQA